MGKEVARKISRYLPVVIVILLIGVFVMVNSWINNKILEELYVEIR